MSANFVNEAVTVAEFAGIWRSTARSNGQDEFTTPAITEKFGRLYELLRDARLNLTAIHSPRDVALLHFADSLTAAPLIPQGSAVLDVGCGGGFPSLPLAVARQDLSVTALDSTAKKLDFVAFAAREMELGSFDTLCGRAEELSHQSLYREKFDVVTARAVAALPILAELCLPFVRPGGIFIAMKAQSALDELEAARGKIAALGAEPDCKIVTLQLKDPDDDIPTNRSKTATESDDSNSKSGLLTRNLLVFRKVSPTLSQYPRPYSKIKNS